MLWRIGMAFFAYFSLFYDTKNSKQTHYAWCIKNEKDAFKSFHEIWWYRVNIKI